MLRSSVIVDTFVVVEKKEKKGKTKQNALADMTGLMCGTGTGHKAAVSVKLLDVSDVGHKFVEQ